MDSCIIGPNITLKCYSKILRALGIGTKSAFFLKELPLKGLPERTSQSPMINHVSQHYPVYIWAIFQISPCLHIPFLPPNCVQVVFVLKEAITNFLNHCRCLSTFLCIYCINSILIIKLKCYKAINTQKETTFSSC